MLPDKIVRGLQDVLLRWMLLQQKQLTLQKCMGLCRSTEMVAQQVQEIDLVSTRT